MQWSLATEWCCEWVRRLAPTGWRQVGFGSHHVAVVRGGLLSSPLRPLGLPGGLPLVPHGPVETHGRDDLEGVKVNLDGLLTIRGILDGVSGVRDQDGSVLGREAGGAVIPPVSDVHLEMSGGYRGHRWHPRLG